MASSTRRFLLAAFAAALAVLLAVSVVAIAGQTDEPVLVEGASPSSHGSPALEGPFQVGGEGVDQIDVLGTPTNAQVAPAPADAKPGSQSALALSLASQGVDRPVPAHAVDQALGEEVTVAELGADACVGIEALATCGSPQEILEGHVVAVELCSPELAAGTYRVIGMAPDGVNAVQIETRDGSSASVPVRENTYEAATTDLPLSIAWQKNGAEALRVPAPVPPDYDPKSCEV